MVPPIPGPSEGLNAAVAAELRAEQGRLRISVPALAKSSDIPYGTLRRYLDGSRNIDVGVLHALAEALDTSAATVVRAAQERLAGATIHQFPVQSDRMPTMDELAESPSAAQPDAKRDVEPDEEPTPP